MSELAPGQKRMLVEREQEMVWDAGYGGAALVVVISAYKPQYLAKTLDSLTQQTNLDFDVLVGDDCGPREIAEVCREFASRLRLRYVRFGTNLGGRSLPQQWDRCIRETDQPWLMLLGDDDLLDPGCVASFLHAMESAPAIAKCPLYRFDTRIIDRIGMVLRENPEHANRVNSLEFVAARFEGRSSYVVEIIFPRGAYEEVGQFVDFPLAWCSDDATWALMALDREIRCIRGPKVSWRLSGDNISSDSPHSALTKTRTNLSYLEWLDQFILPRYEDDVAVSKRVRLLGVNWFFRTAAQLGAVFPLTDVPALAQRLARFSGVSPILLMFRLARVKYWVMRRRSRA